MDSSTKANPRKPEPWPPPAPLTALLKTLAWNDVYLRSDLEPHRSAIEAAEPPFFKEFSDGDALPNV